MPCVIKDQRLIDVLQCERPSAVCNNVDTVNITKQMPEEVCSLMSPADFVAHSQLSTFNL